MKQFAALYDAIDSTTSTNAKVAAMVAYFKQAAPADAAWAVFFLTGRRLKRLISYPSIHSWTLAATGLESWLLEESYSVVGDGAETAALVLDQVAVVASEDVPLSEWVEGRILPLRELDEDTQERRVTSWWSRLDRLQRFMLLKILTGELRVGVSHTLVVRALAQAAAFASCAAWLAESAGRRMSHAKDHCRRTSFDRWNRAIARCAVGGPDKGLQVRRLGNAVFR